MASLLAITRFLNKLLDIRNIPDNSRNGMQVNCRNDVKRIGFCVDASLEVFELAKKKKCDLIIAHHGILWKPQRYKKNLEKRISYLKKNKISLYGAHLPLDKHDKYGNNILLANFLGLKNIKEFGKYNRVAVGFMGVFPKPISLVSIKRLLDKKLRTNSYIKKNNDKLVKTIGIISGGGNSVIEEAIDKRLDCFLTGDKLHQVYGYAKESKLNVVSAGHYATETVGVKALMPLLKERFGVETVFLDAPTNL
ncbi:Nif3-like dinuclear metal center hexameric protein [Candidatus Woesearchaeota archaeon]|nr:Nif3-like dinuclear metal center hexameric protein [Candidatus Woesearchaeota archaeon]